MSEERQRFDKLYQEQENVFGLGAPEEIVRDILSYRQSGVVLELGAGQGRNALFLAKHGFDVLAQDVSSIGVNQMIQQAQQEQLPLRTWVGDARKLPTTEVFDVMVCTFVLHFLEKNDAVALITRLQQQTQVEGLHVIACFSREGNFFKKNPDTTRFFPTRQELQELYADWNIVTYSEETREAKEKNPDGTVMENVVLFMTVRKNI